jgi:hypothetical protein
MKFQRQKQANACDNPRSDSGSRKVIRRIGLSGTGVWAHVLVRCEAENADIESTGQEEWVTDSRTRLRS